VSATSQPSLHDLSGRAWRNVRCVAIGMGTAAMLGVALALASPGLAKVAGLFLVVLAPLPALGAALVEWWSDRRARGLRGRPSAGS
jgi:hypothetical protein